ncbi:hypothetical protein BDZ94DRAFT_698096 [Collybia nuda]|uniref:Uncharacterized protein n=1 Tax=Collybia nuda TaxID=64659 RepID=A0A9P5Y5U7_9AGAR|nr:hypothetical protein BDZ94DRAFT_698096 [Collybia nuda]
MTLYSTPPGTKTYTVLYNTTYILGFHLATTCVILRISDAVYEQCDSSAPRTTV